MATMRYFGECQGQPVRLANPYHDGSRTTAATAFLGRCPAGHEHRATRRIDYKAQPSKHACDARCVKATGRDMHCECSCGGLFHGRAA